MKRFALIVLVAVTPLNALYAQGWVAEVRLELNHDDYAYESIQSATITYSGVTVSSSSPTRHLFVNLKGTGLASGSLSINVAGIAYEPYLPETPPTSPMAARLHTTTNTPCVQAFFEREGSDTHHALYVWVTLYPRLSISSSTRSCERITLTSPDCAPSYTWEVGENIGGPYYEIGGASGQTLSVTPEEIAAAGLGNPYGRKYFRVTGKSGTTSEIRAEDIYFPAPDASVEALPPKCHNGNDGQLRVLISAAHPAIDDFVVTLFGDAGLKQVVTQKYVNDHNEVILESLSPGSYWVVVQNNTSISVYGSCWSTLATPVIANPPAVIINRFETSDYNGFATRCHTSSDAFLRAVPTGGTGVYPAFEWTHAPENVPLLRDLPAGIYTVRVKDSNGCWSEPRSHTLASPPPLTVKAIPVSDYNGYAVSCLDKQNGTVEALVSGGIAPYNIEWSTGASQRRLEGMPTGAYRVEVVDHNGCEAAAETVLTAPPEIKLNIRELAPVRCAGNHDGALVVQDIMNNIGAIAIEWSSGETTPMITDKPAATYTVTIRDEQGCIATRAHTLEDPPGYDVEIMTMSDYNGSAISCAGASDGALKAVLQDFEGHVQDAHLYTWKREDEIIQTGVDDMISDLASGIYEIEASYGQGCTARDVYILSDPDQLIAEIAVASDYNGAPISCHGASDGSLRLIAKGGTGDYQFLWPDSTTGPGLLGVSAGVYQGIVTDQNGCTSVASVELIDPPPLDASILVRSSYNGAAISCAGNADAWLTADVTGGVPAYQFLWNTGAKSANLIDVPAGTYIVTVQDRNGCTITVDTSLADPTPIKVDLDESSEYNGYGVSCADAADGFLVASAVGGTGAYRYSWNNGAAIGPRYEKLPAGYYHVSVSDANGCRDSLTITLAPPDPLSLTISDFSNLTCSDSRDGNIRLDVTGGAAPYHFSIDGMQWQDAAVFTDLDAGLHSLQVRDANGCQHHTIATLASPPPLVVTPVSLSPALCGDPRGSAQAMPDGGTPPYQFGWQDISGRTVSDEPVADALSSGIYTVVLTDAQGCVARATTGITTTDGPQIDINAIKATSCFESKDGAASVNVSGGRQPYDFWWEAGSQTPEATALPKGDHLVQVTDADGCTAVATATVPGPEPLEVLMKETQMPRCAGRCDGSLEVTARGGNGAYTFQWSNAEGPALSNLCQGRYSVIATDALGCTATEIYELVAPEPLTVQLEEARSPHCADGCDGRITVMATGGSGDYNYKWTTGQNVRAVEGLCDGPYGVVVTDARGCTAEAQFELVDPEPLVVELGAPLTLCDGQTHTLDAGPQWQHYNWIGPNGFSSSDRRITIHQAGAYGVKVIDEMGCAATDTFRLFTSTDLLAANFLLTTESATGDSIVIIDVSWPLPENIYWEFPKALTVLENKGDIMVGRFDTAGEYEVSLTAVLGGCRDVTSKRIVVYDSTRMSASGRLGYESALVEFSLYPNPNEGSFNVVVELKEPKTIVVSVWSTVRAVKVAEVRGTGQQRYDLPFDLRPLSTGTYVLHLDYGDGRRTLRFVVR